MSWVLAFVGFSLLIVLHELGHFLAAKAVGMRAERFMLFFGKPLVSVRRGETEYGIGSIPLGGYVKITGMDPREELDPEVAPRAYLNQPVWKRIVVIAAGPVVNVVVAFVILVGLFTINGIDTVEPTIGAVQSGTPAAGQLRPGERILSVDGRPAYDGALGPEASARRTRETRELIGSHGCAGDARRAGCRAAVPATLVVQAPGGEPRTVRLRPAYDADARRMLLGVAFAQAPRTVGVPEATRLTVDGMWRVTTLSVSTFSRIVYSSEAREQVSGPVGSYERTRQSFELGYDRAFEILALISLSLAIINLFPFLPLDGGHIFWALAEKVRRKPVPFRWMERASVVGFMLILALFALGLTNDLGAIFGEGISVREEQGGP